MCYVYFGVGWSVKISFYEGCFSIRSYISMRAQTLANSELFEFDVGMVELW